MQKNAYIADLTNQSNNTERWGLLWRRRLFEWEKDLLHDLLETINPIGPLSDVGDDMVFCVFVLRNLVRYNFREKTLLKYRVI
jgi:hypothetical protein